MQDGHYIRWDGNCHVGRFTVAGSDADRAICNLAQGFEMELNTWMACDWLADCDRDVLQKMVNLDADGLRAEEKCDAVRIWGGLKALHESANEYLQELSL